MGKKVYLNTVAEIENGRVGGRLDGNSAEKKTEKNVDRRLTSFRLFRFFVTIFSANGGR